MASALSHFEVQESDYIFKCSICLENFKSPKSLPCLHTFCKQCIHEYIESTERKHGKKLSNYLCPVCRALTSPTDLSIETSKWASLLPDNFNITSMMESVKGSESRKECQTCYRQEIKSEGVFWCKDCEEILCDSCCSHHKFLKITMNHQLVKLEANGSENYELDLNAISDKCPVHSKKVAEAFCFDHNKLCCVLCLTVNHRKCNDVRVIEDISDDQNKKLMEISTVLKEVESNAECIISRKQKSRKDFEESVQDVAKHLHKIVGNAKNKLDNLLKFSLKEIDVMRNETDSKMQEELKAIQQLQQQVSHLSKVNSVVLDRGTRCQQFVHCTNITTQLESNILTILKHFEEDFDLRMTFDLSDLLKELDTVETMGTIAVSKSPILNEKARMAIKLTHALKCVMNKNFEVTLSNCRVIKIDKADLTCGVYINDQVLLCGDYKNFKILEIELETGLVRQEKRYYLVKYIAFDELNNFVYVSYADGFFQQYEYKYNKFQSSFSKRNEINGNGSLLLGGLALQENHVYTIVDNWIKRMEVNNSINFINMFPSKTNCTNDIQNGLAIDAINLRFVYTSKESEIIATTLQGKHIFSYKNEEIRQPTCVVVHSSGMILVGDKSSSVHVISMDGKIHKTILDKSQNIKKLCGIWMDKNEQTLFICGNEFIEMYSLYI